MTEQPAKFDNQFRGDPPDRPTDRTPRPVGVDHHPSTASSTSTREQTHDMDGPTFITRSGRQDTIDQTAPSLVPVETIWACIDAKHDVGTRHHDGQLDQATCHDCGNRYDRHWSPIAEPVVSSAPVSPVDLDLAAVEAAVRALESEEWSANLPVYNLAETVLAAAGMPALVAEVKRLRVDRDDADRVRMDYEDERDEARQERDEALAAVDRVRALIAHARKISPSPSMHVYVADLERALGIDAPRPHKLGSES